MKEELAEGLRRGDTVVVTKGIYKGAKGEVCLVKANEWTGSSSYVVRLGNSESNELTFSRAELDKV